MSKLLLLVVVLLLVFWVIRAYGRGARKQDAPPRQTGAGEDMVRCAQCGVHLPRSESVTSRGEFFCGDDHRRQRLG